MFPLNLGLRTKKFKLLTKPRPSQKGSKGIKYKIIKMMSLLPLLKD